MKGAVRSRASACAGADGATTRDALVCREAMARHSRSFSMAARLFPPARRDEVAAVYAWCRRCDDAIDRAPASQTGPALASLEERLASIHSGEPQRDAVSRRFQTVVRERRIPIAYPRELLAGMAMDVRGTRYERPEDLLLYAWRVAGTVGLMMCHVMGVTRREAVVNAAHLGMAMQLTNVCRDIAEDWERGRLYLPSSLFDAPTAARLQRECGGPPPLWAEPALSQATRRLLAWSERYYASGTAGLDALAPRSALAVRTASRIYAAIGREIERRGATPFSGRAVVSAPRKLALLGSCLVQLAQDRRPRGEQRAEPPHGVLRFGPSLVLPLPAGAVQGAR